MSALRVGRRGRSQLSQQEPAVRPAVGVVWAEPSDGDDNLVGVFSEEISLKTLPLIYNGSDESFLAVTSAERTGLLTYTFDVPDTFVGDSEYVVYWPPNSPVGQFGGQPSPRSFVALS